MIDRYTSIGVKESTRDRIIECAKPRESWDETLLRVVDTCQSLQIIRQKVADHSERIAEALKPFVETADQNLLAAMQKVVAHLEDLRALIVNPPQPQKQPKPREPRFAEIMEALREKRAMEKQENE